MSEDDQMPAFSTITIEYRDRMSAINDNARIVVDAPKNATVTATMLVLAAETDPDFGVALELVIAAYVSTEHKKQIKKAFKQGGL